MVIGVLPLQLSCQSSNYDPYPVLFRLQGIASDGGDCFMAHV